MILDIVNHSENKNDICMSEEVYRAMFGLRDFMFEHVYTDPDTKKEEGKVEHIIAPLYEHYMKHLELLPQYSQERIRQGTESREQAVCDYIAGMTDHYAIETYKEIFIPKFWIIR